MRHVDRGGEEPCGSDAEPLSRLSARVRRDQALFTQPPRKTAELLRMAILRSVSLGDLHALEKISRGGVQLRGGGPVLPARVTPAIQTAAKTKSKKAAGHDDE